ncbi:MAG: glycoside hydrolase family 97 protein [Bacteroidota bacterium]
MIQKLLLACTVCMLLIQPMKAQDDETIFLLTSPNQRFAVNILLGKDIQLVIERQNETLGFLRIGMDGLEGPFNGKKMKEVRSEGMDDLTPAVPHKRNHIQSAYNQQRFSFPKQKMHLTVRMYDDGLAYRFEAEKKGEWMIKHEQMDLKLPKNTRTFFPKEDTLTSHFERYYANEEAAKIPAGDFCSLPVLFQSPKGTSILLTEADLYDYPGLFLQKGNDGDFHSKFPHVVDEAIPLPEYPDRSQIITKTAPFIAQTTGTRTFPWRIMALAERDHDLLHNTLVHQLSRPLAIEDPSWIRPGRVAWDWWNANNIYGVDFESGINNQTYQYYIDFAAEYGLEYIILDEGWSKSTTDLLHCKKDIDVAALVKYGEEKGVGIILWCLWNPLDKDMDRILDQFVRWGVKGIKVDFMQRADQEIVNFYEKTARKAAEHQLLVDFHGAYKPSGLRRAYPNVLSYEGVNGLEQCKWSDKLTATHNVTLPFTRMVAGPMDYTPGAMDNAQPDNYAIRFERPMSLGTRCHQMAMYVVYESPLQMLADNPSQYRREKECTEYIAQIPSIWDETLPLGGKVGQYVVIARRKGDRWYLAAMNNEEARTVELNLSFLSGEIQELDIMQDGPNAARVAVDYLHQQVSIPENKMIKIQLAPGGGWVAVGKP